MKIPMACLAVAWCWSNISGAADGNWPRFRGPNASGVSDQAAPVTWNVETGENVRWQTSLPGLAHSSPIVWQDRVYVATAVRPGEKAQLKIGLYGAGDSYAEKELHQWRLICLDKASGRVIWNQLAHEAVPRLERHTKATHCNSTPATDGKRIVAMLGSEGLFGFNLKGERLWHQDLGKLHAGPYDTPRMQWGFASSPVLHDGKVIVQCDTLSESFLAVFDADNGRPLWRTKRNEVSTWSTPVLATVRGQTQILVNGWKHIGGYDFQSGQELWQLHEGGDIPVASPIVARDLLVLTSGHGKYRPMRAIRLADAHGDITPAEMGATNNAVAWCHARKGNYMQTPIAVGDLLFGCLDTGVLTCFDLKTGAVHYEQRLGTGNQGYTASPVAAKDRLYFTSEPGEVFVIPVAREFSVIATNKLGGISLSTPALSEGTIYFRTTEKLIAIGTQ